MNIKKFVINDNILIKFASSECRTASGLILPDSEGREVICGYVKDYGQGYAHFDFDADSNIPGHKKERVYHIPLKVMIGDQVYFYERAGAPILLDGEKYFIVAEKNILLVIRQEMI